MTMVEKKNRASHLFGSLCHTFFFDVLFGIILTFLENRFQHNNGTIHNDSKIYGSK